MKKSLFLTMLVSINVLYGKGAQEHCLGCHDIFKLSNAYTKSEWRKVLSKHNKRLRTLHKDQKEVLAYLSSAEYSSADLYDDLSFYAHRTKAMQQLPVTCYGCHSASSEMARLWSNEKWMYLFTSVEPLVKAHENYPKVAAYVQTPLFKAGLREIVQEMKFFAKSEKELKKSREEEEIMHYCIQCHQSKTSLAYSLTKGQWKSLHESLEPLKKLHPMHPKVITYIDSDLFKRNKAYLIEEMVFFAPKSLANEMELEHNGITLYYKQWNVTKEETQEILDTIVKTFHTCEEKTPIRFELKPLASQGRASAIMTFFSFGLIPSSESRTLELRAKYKGKVYAVEKTIHYYHGLGSQESDSYADAIQELIEMLHQKMTNVCQQGAKR